MSTAARLGLLLLVSLLSGAAAPAQQSTPGTQDAASKIYLDVVVTPRTGPPVTSLQQKDFSVFDNKAPQPITSFHAFSGKEAPMEVILMIDAVNTSYQNIAYERGQIDKFLRANGGRLAHPTTLAVFTDTGTQIQPDFSSDGNALSASLDRYTVGLRSIRRSAGFYGAAERFQLSIGALRQLAAREATRPGRKIVVWISPGWPLLSGPNVELSSKERQQIYNEVVSLSTQLRKTRITLYSVDPLGTSGSTFRTFYYEEFLKGVTKPSEVNIGDLSLQVLATQSGGLVLNSSNDVAALLQTCIADTEAYYEIAFQPPAPERPYEYHHVEVRLTNPNLLARTRQGYYAQP